MADGKKETVLTSSRRVSTVLAAAGVRPGSKDMVIPRNGTGLKEEDDSVKVIRVKEEVVEKDIVIPRSVKTIDRDYFFGDRVCRRGNDAVKAQGKRRQELARPSGEHGDLPAGQAEDLRGVVEVLVRILDSGDEVTDEPFVFFRLSVPPASNAGTTGGMTPTNRLMKTSPFCVKRFLTFFEAPWQPLSISRPPRG